MRTSLAIVLVLAGLPALAFAGKDAPAPGSQHNPPVYVDETTFYVRLLSREDGGYGFAAKVEVYGLASGSDLLRLDWKQKGKVLATAKCSVGIDGSYASGECRHDDNSKLIQAKGAIDAELIYWDDKEEKEYLVRAIKVTVGVWKDKKKVMYQILPDDVLASAYLYHGGANASNDTFHRPVIYFWTASDAAMPRAVLRCSVDGKKLDQDFELSDGGDLGSIDHVHYTAKGDKQRYVWQQHALSLDLYWGSKDTLPDWAQGSGKVMQDHPGKWECQLRTDGRAIRRFSFTVDKDGMVQQDEMQSGKNAIPTSGGTVLIDVRIPEDAKWDVRIRPDAMKKGMGFGLPWPEHDKVKEIHKSFPAKSGLADP